MANFFAHTLLRARDWQHRPQLDDVCAWWRGGGASFQLAGVADRKLEAYAMGGRGVCALIGMGGAGKTAVAERFLRILPGGLPEDPSIPKDPSMPTPHSTFVFSFYDAPNAEAFFESLQMWLQNTPQVETVLSFGQMGFLLQQRQGLVVLDGLERVQHDGQRGEFGRLESPKLRDFLNQLAAGMYADLSVLVTSRFPLAHLRDKNPRFFHPVPVNQIDLTAGVQLLRERGVHGTDPQLEPIVEQCGRHALTVDLAGGYIAEFGEGDPATPLDLGSAEQLQAYDEQFVIYNVSIDPIVIVGGGRVGRAVARAMTAREIDWRVIEQVSDRVSDAERVIVGDAADVELLSRAGIRQAPAVLITTHDDDLNVYLTIYCRSVRPDIQIMTRATLERNVAAMHRAGADFVMSYASMGATSMFNLIRGSRIVSIAEGLEVFRMPVPESLATRTIADSGVRETTGCTIVAVSDDSGLRINPPADMPMVKGREDPLAMCHLRHGVIPSPSPYAR